MNKYREKKKEKLISKEERILLTYGHFCKSMDSLRHYDSLQSINESKVSNANWYAVAAAGFLFSITTNPHLTLFICIAIGFADIMYITACFINSLVITERFYISFFYELIQIEEKETWLPPVYHCMFIKEDKELDKNSSKHKFSHHGSPHLKAIYYVINLFIPFVILIFIPSYILFSKTTFYFDLSNMMKNLFAENGIANFPLVLSFYIFICLIIFISYSLMLFTIIGPMKTLFKTIYRMNKKNVR